MDLKVVTYDPHAADHVALIILNRPDRLNGWTYRMENEVRWCMRAADANEGVRVIVLTGAGRGFCAGADMQGLEGYAAGADYEVQDVGTAEPEGDFSGNFTYLLGLSKPVIAAVNGPAAGVGFVLACFCDVRFAAAGAKITTSFARLGLPAEHGVSWVLPRIIGAGRAADLLFSSRVVLAEEAMSLGLVNRVSAPESLMGDTLAYAAAMAQLAPSSLRAIKQQLWGNGTLADAWQDSLTRMLVMLESPEFAEGVAAFREKRPPNF